MKKLTWMLLIVLVSIIHAGIATAAPIDAQISINGDDFLQSFTVQNNSDAGLNISSLVYSLGVAADGIATWDTFDGGGVASDFLSNPRWFQTVTWSGLSIAPGASFSISSFSLDIDWITTVLPLIVREDIIDNLGMSLANAYFGVGYNNGFFGTVALNQTGWTTSQNLRLTSDVPEPSTIFLLGAGLVGMGLLRRRFRN